MKRKFIGSICVTSDTHHKIEIADGTEHGGDPNTYRLRLGRRWVNDEDGNTKFFTKSMLAKFITNTVLAELPKSTRKPNMHAKQRCSIDTGDDSLPVGGWTESEPIRDSTGQWVILVGVGGKREFVPCWKVRV